MGTDLKTYKIGIVGCGTISGTHGEAIESTKYGSLVAAYSRTASKLDAFCNRFGVVGFSDYEKFLSQPDMDTVVICTPSGTHLDYGDLAAQAGKHVIVEKPIEISVERGRALIERCREKNVQLAVIYQNRFIDGVIKMKDTIDEGELGELFMVDTSVKWFRDQDYYDSAEWRGTLSLDGGGAVINQAIHTVDLMLWLCGDIESLFAFKGTFTHEGIEGEDNAVAALKFKSGVIGVFKASTSVVPPMKRKIAVHGTGGTALLDGDVFRMMVSERDLKEDSDNNHASGSSGPLAGMTTNYHKKQYDQILEAFQHNEKPVVSGEESLKSLAIVEALYKSAERKEEIHIEEFFPKEKFM